MDEASLDATFEAYRTRLLAAVEQQRESMLLPLVSRDIRSSFGSDGGVDEFQEHWRTSSPDSPLWPELHEILTLGGSFRGEGAERMFWAPYVYSRWPDGFDAFEHVAGVRAGVPLLEQPDDGARVVAMLDWPILRVIDMPNERESWRHVRATASTEGWVRAADVRSPIGYRAGFKQVRGEWKMTALVAGD